MKVSVKFHFESKTEAREFFDKLDAAGVETPSEASESAEATEPAAGKRGRPSKTKEVESVAVDEDSLSDLGIEEDEAPKHTIDDVTKAVKAFAEKKDVAAAKAVLKKFKVASARDLKPEQYADVIAALK